eukprot:6490886-Amphidinium_carterae.3
MSGAGYPSEIWGPVLSLLHPWLGRGSMRSSSRRGTRTRGMLAATCRADVLVAALVTHLATASVVSSANFGPLA